MADDQTTEQPTDEPAATLTKDIPPAAVHLVEQPLGTEFPLTAHESIAAKLEAKIEDVCYAIETDVEAGVHRLKGWLKI
jgi:hypothetical protein